MAPGYVATFAKEHKLKAPARDVKECLLSKAGVVLRNRLPKQVRGNVTLGCACNITTVFSHLVGKVDLILTSPPYLDAQTYAKDNWLRLWLLGHDHRVIKPQYIETGSLRKYRTYMIKVAKQCESMLKPGGHLIVIAGDVRRKTHKSERPKFRTGSYLAKLVETKLSSMAIMERGSHSVKSTSRYFHSLSKSNGHAKRSLTERFFVAKKRKA
jgi:DNA modification methylase